MLTVLCRCWYQSSFNPSILCISISYVHAFIIPTFLSLCSVSETQLWGHDRLVVPHVDIQLILLLLSRYCMCGVLFKLKGLQQTNTCKKLHTWLTANCNASIRRKIYKDSKDFANFTLIKHEMSFRVKVSMSILEQLS